tara:strand:- start:449 stop:586 length:138 start_codon:yes stop_codon:yes gene_type:complete
MQNVLFLLFQKILYLSPASRPCVKSLALLLVTAGWQGNNAVLLFL